MCDVTRNPIDEQRREIRVALIVSAVAAVSVTSTGGDTVAGAGEGVGVLLMDKWDAEETLQLIISAAHIRIEANVAALFAKIRDENARPPTAGGHIVNHGHARLDLEEDDRFGRVAILVALGVICSGWVGQDFGNTFLMCLMHLLVVGLIGPMVVGKGWCGQSCCS